MKETVTPWRPDLNMGHTHGKGTQETSTFTGNLWTQDFLFPGKPLMVLDSGLGVDPRQTSTKEQGSPSAEKVWSREQGFHLLTFMAFGSFSEIPVTISKSSTSALEKVSDNLAHTMPITASPCRWKDILGCLRGHSKQDHWSVFLGSTKGSWKKALNCLNLKTTTGLKIEFWHLKDSQFQRFQMLA
ncbi:uncharacterized protein LOC132534857 isoform X2 [Erinaceus europaeus]|uniref:Uncharacterized protein LOC132534857 isoform X2 n=1 Tax=Erinaceus europaeus TaxID=9365 RepID=A0ABM3WFH2_ERIEU|nr:uncharacterized protein LOC132534857 isoform X2 [Erinaceus europaeus]